jgi:hypothetical protein
MKSANAIERSGMKPSQYRVFCAFALGVSLAAGGWAQDAGTRDLALVSLEDLMNIQVTSVSKKEQSLLRTGAAVFVITARDIRRSGLKSIPDLLRMAPGVEVARTGGLVQYGSKAGKNGHCRVLGRYFKVENSAAAEGGPAADGSSEGQTITTLFSNQLPEYRTFNDKVRTGSGNILGRWEHKFSNGSETKVQSYFERVRRAEDLTDITVAERLD